MAMLVDLKSLYEQYGFIIYRRCATILRSEDEAKDAMHSVFVKFADEYHRIREKGAAVAWIYKAATNHCFNLLRDRRKFDPAVDADLLPDRGDLESRIDARRAINMLMHGTDARMRDAVYFTYVEELSQEEIRAITGQSPATIRRNLAKFRERVARFARRPSGTGQ
jgi:RNA polymerase sigma-70 factor (ECF subfamily)